MILQENDLQFNFTDATNALMFDQQDRRLPDFHDIPNMPRVDFIVEFENDIIFIEVKDPEHPDTEPEHLERFKEKIDNQKLESSLADKYHYSFFFRWGEGQLNKTVHYLSLITLETALLADIDDGLNRKLHLLNNSSSRWIRRPLGNCQIFNIETWNENFPSWPITRISSQAS